MIVYPDYLPCPEISNYRGEINMGVLNTSIRGHVKQRRKHRTMPSGLQGTFVVRDAELGVLQQFLRQAMTVWASIPMVSMYNQRLGGGPAENHIVRVMNDVLEAQAIDDSHFRLSVTFQLSPTHYLEAM